MSRTPALERIRSANPITADQIATRLPVTVQREFARLAIPDPPAGATLEAATAGVIPFPNRRRRTRIARRAAVAAAVIVGGVGAAIALPSGPGTSTAFASWNPTPTPVTGTAAAAAATQCRRFIGLESDTTLIVAEKRGIYSFTALTGPDSLWSCLTSPSADGGLVGGGGGGSGFAHTLEPLTGDRVLAIGGGGSGAQGRQSYVSIIGRYGPQVTAISVELHDGTEAQATLTGGWWTTWAPGTHEPTWVRIRHADGTVIRERIVWGG